MACFPDPIYGYQDGMSAPITLDDPAAEWIASVFHGVNYDNVQAIELNEDGGCWGVWGIGHGVGPPGATHDWYFFDHVPSIQTADTFLGTQVLFTEDPSPGPSGEDDFAFTEQSGPNGRWVVTLRTGLGAELGREGLMTVVAHELGHVMTGLLDAELQRRGSSAEEALRAVFNTSAPWNTGLWAGRLLEAACETFKDMILPFRTYDNKTNIRLPRANWDAFTHLYVDVVFGLGFRDDYIPFGGFFTPLSVGSTAQTYVPIETASTLTIWENPAWEFASPVFPPSDPPPAQGEQVPVYWCFDFTDVNGRTWAYDPDGLTELDFTAEWFDFSNNSLGTESWSLTSADPPEGSHMVTAPANNGNWMKLVVTFTGFVPELYYNDDGSFIWQDLDLPNGYNLHDEPTRLVWARQWTTEPGPLDRFSPFLQREDDPISYHLPPWPWCGYPAYPYRDTPRMDLNPAVAGLVRDKERIGGALADSVRIG